VTFRRGHVLPDRRGFYAKADRRARCHGSGKYMYSSRRTHLASEVPGFPFMARRTGHDGSRDPRQIGGPVSASHGKHL